MRTPPSAPEPASTGPVAGVDDVVEAKAELRARLRAARRDRSPARRAAESAAAVEHLWGWLGPRVAEAVRDGDAVVATVLPMPTEPDTAPLRERLMAAGARVLVPVIEPGRRLSWTDWRPGVATARAANAPVDEPVGERHGVEALAGAVAVVMPALAVAEDGMRLGQGGGYYDRFLAELPLSVPTVALVFEDELLPAGAVPAEPTDRPVDAVVTAAGLRHV